MEFCESKDISSDNIVEVVIDLDLYTMTAIKKCCYKFTADCFIQMNKINQHKLKLAFTFFLDKTAEEKNMLIGQFYNELLDQDLREIIAKETEPVRNLILAEAFSKTSLLETE